MGERGTCPKSLMERSKGHQEHGYCLAMRCVCVIDSSSCVSKRSVPLVGCPALPFIDQGGSRVYKWEKEEKTKGREGPSREPGLPFPLCLPCPLADPYRAMPWPSSASGCVPSYTGGRCGVPESRAVTLRRVDGEVTIRPSL